MKPVVEMQKIVKRFPGVVALKNISFDLLPGEVHVLVGENGAGKSTLMKILAGVYAPTSGELLIGGQTYAAMTPQLAQQAGIAIIYQELSVIDQLSIAENLFVGRLPTKRRLGVSVLDRARLREKAAELLKRVGLTADPETPAETLSISQKQQVEIAKALSLDARILVMDEPTSSLTEDEVQVLFQVIRALRESGVAIVYISHKLKEIRQIGDRLTVLKDGETVATKLVSDVTDDAEIVSLMVGRELSNQRYNLDPGGVHEEVMLSVRNLSRADGRVRDVSFDLRKGEILGFAGLVGAGRTELMETVFGSFAGRKTGSIRFKGRELQSGSPFQSIRSGIGMITENRRRSGFLPNFDIWRNVVIPFEQKHAPAGGLGGLVNRSRHRAMAERFCSQMGVRCTSVDQMMVNLSGGNQQKAIIAKWLMAGSDLLIFDEPTRGIDVGAKNEIYRLMRELVREGRSILMVSSELPELLAVCDRIIVFNQGRISAAFDTREATEASILFAATEH